MEFSELTPEQKAKARACSTPEELAALAEAEGVELSDEQLEGISGGWGGGCSDYVCSNRQCPPYDES